MITRCLVMKRRCASLRFNQRLLTMDQRIVIGLGCPASTRRSLCSCKIQLDSIVNELVRSDSSGMSGVHVLDRFRDHTTVKPINLCFREDCLMRGFRSRPFCTAFAASTA